MIIYNIFRHEINFIHIIYIFLRNIILWNFILNVSNQYLNAFSDDSGIWKSSIEVNIDYNCELYSIKCWIRTLSKHEYEMSWIEKSSIHWKHHSWTNSIIYRIIECVEEYSVLAIYVIHSTNTRSSTSVEVDALLEIEHTIVFLHAITQIL